GLHHSDAAAHPAGGDERRGSNLSGGARSFRSGLEPGAGPPAGSGSLVDPSRWGRVVRSLHTRRMRGSQATPFRGGGPYRGAVRPWKGDPRSHLAQARDPRDRLSFRPPHRRLTRLRIYPRQAVSPSNAPRKPARVASRVAVLREFRRRDRPRKRSAGTEGSPSSTAIRRGARATSRRSPDLPTPPLPPV